MQCKNCRFQLKNEQNYCSNCGARVIDKRLTVNHLSGEFFESFWSIDANKPLLTFLDLFRIPAEVIDGYINGLRKKYINPYGYFTIALTLTGLYTFINLNYFPEYLDNRGISANVGDQDVSRSVTTKILEHINLITFLFIPVITLISRLVFLKNKKYNTAEHLIIHLYAYSHVNIITGILILISFVHISAFGAMNLVSLPLYLIYYGIVFKQLYKLTIWKTILKTLLFLFIIGLFFLAISVLLGLFLIKHRGEI